MKFSYTLTVQDLNPPQKKADGGYSIKITVILFVMACLLLFSSLSLLKNYSSTKLISTILFAIAFGFLFFLYFLHIKKQTPTLGADKFPFGRYEVALEDKVFHIKSSQSESIHNWGLFEKLEETPTHFYLYLNLGMRLSLVIRKASIEPSALVSEISSFLKQKISHT